MRVYSYYSCNENSVGAPTAVLHLNMIAYLCLLSLDYTRDQVFYVRIPRFAVEISRYHTYRMLISYHEHHFMSTVIVQRHLSTYLTAKSNISTTWNQRPMGNKDCNIQEQKSVVRPFVMRIFLG